MTINIETRLSLLEQQVADHHMLFSIITNLIIHHDEDLRLKIAEGIRGILENPLADRPIPESVQQSLRWLQDAMLSPNNEEFVLMLSCPLNPLVNHTKAESE